MVLFLLTQVGEMVEGKTRPVAAGTLGLQRISELLCPGNVS